MSTPHHVRALQHGLDDRDEDEELDEFQALEAQITKDVGTSLKPGPSSRLAGNPFAHGVSQRGTYKVSIILGSEAQTSIATATN